MDTINTIAFMVIGTILTLGSLLGMLSPVAAFSPLLIITVGFAGLLTFWVPIIVNISK